MKPRILIVEDEPLIARTIAQVIDQLGYEHVATSAYGEEAVRLASELKFDLALVDIRLAGEMDGIGTATILQKRFALASVLMTASPEQEIIERAIHARPYGYLLKPFTPQELHLVVAMAQQRLQTESTLRQREEQHETVLRTSMDSFWIVDLEGHILDVNDAACRMTGYDRAELLKMRIIDLEHGRTLEQITEGIKVVLSRGSAQIDRLIRRKDGQLRLIEMSITCSPRQRLFCFGRDITERRKVETRLQLLKRAVEQSPASIVITDPKGAIEYVNPFFEKHTGYTAQEAIGLNPRVLNSGEHTKEFFQTLWESISAGNEWRGEIRNRRKDGSLYWEQASISPMRDENGQIVNYVAVKEDISERKATEHAMAWQAALVENSADICCVKDLNLRVITANQAMARAAGVDSPDRLIGKTDAEIFKRTANTEEVKAFMDDERAVQRLYPGQCLVRQERMHAADNADHYQLTRKFPVFDRRGKLIATANISTDITESKRAEQDLIRAKDEAETANRAKSAFLATMSHELRTPLNVINGMSALLAQENWPPEHKHAINLISEGGNNLLRIIEEILDYSGLQAGKAQLDESPFSVVNVVSSVLRLCEGSAQSKGLDLTYSLDPKLPAETLGDSRRLQQILINLLNNAVKFTERGRIHLRVAVKASTSSTHTIEFAILDSGIGISPEGIEKLFLPFSQADGSITRRFGGTGLGLAITKSFVKLMGGEIRVRSRHNLGSIFQFHVKLKTTNNPATAFSSLASPALQKKRVLIAGFSGAPQRMLSALLRDWDMQPIVPKLRLSSAGQTYPTIDYDIAILPVKEALDTTHPLSTWLDKTSRDKQHPIIWQGHKGEIPPARYNGPSVRIGTFIEPVELNQVLIELLTANPTHRVPRAAKAEKPRPLAEVLPLSILAAEDNATNREVIKLVLRHLGYTVDLVENGAEAVNAVLNKKYDLLLLDMQMPVMDGLTAASEICRLIPDPAQRLKIVALTANALPGDREQCLAAGMDSYLTKPFVPADLTTCLRHLFQSGENNSPSKPQPPKPQPSSHEPLWLDTVHLENITAGLAPEQSLDTLRQLHTSVCNDYADTMPQVVECCAQKDQPRFAQTIHGLKGCFMMIGWNHVGQLCADALGLARKGEFKEWSKFADKLGSAFAHSSESMAKLLDARGAQIQSSQSPKANA
ncbi:MAG: PAS domain S-box protein [Verrucomicrobia bacterium]|nr:PAS domain S-box protein [Verrucomicrobiota bacterium]